MRSETQNLYRANRELTIVNRQWTISDHFDNYSQCCFPFTFHSSLFTFHSSLFTLHSSLFTLHSTCSERSRTIHLLIYPFRPSFYTLGLFKKDAGSFLYLF